MNDRNTSNFAAQESVGVKRKVRPSTVIVGGIALLLIVISLISSGISGAVIMAAMFGFFTGAYTLLTGRPSWARLARRRVGAATLGVSFVAVIIGAVASPPAEDTVPVAMVAEQTKSAAPKNPETAKPTPSTSPEPAADVAPVDSGSVVTINGKADAPNDQPKYGTTALALLETLEVKGRAPKTGYDRDEFGQPWLDVDRNGCDTRNDMLNRDLDDIVHANSVPCKVKSGILEDPYTDTTIPFLRGQDTSIEVQIDHVVALADAWQKGAQQLTFEERVAFANDPLNLQSTDGPTNAQKGAGDAATWLPPNTSYRCEYVARQISVKATYDLWVTKAERDAMARVLGSCADIMAPTDQAKPEPKPKPKPKVEPKPKPEPKPEPEPQPAVAEAYPNCATAAAAGAFNIPVGAPGYGEHLDGDRDGVACESGAAGGVSEPAPAPVAPAPAAPAPAPPANVYYQNCDAVRAAGAAPIYPGDPGFQPKFDGNGDGVGCE